MQMLFTIKIVKCNVLLKLCTMYMQMRNVLTKIHLDFRYVFMDFFSMIEKIK